MGSDGHALFFGKLPIQAAGRVIENVGEFLVFGGRQEFAQGCITFEIAN